VAREKGALYRNLSVGGAIVVNLDDPWVKRLGARFKGKKWTYGTAGQVRAEAVALRNAHGLAFTLQIGERRSRIRLNYLGQHNVANALGAATMAVAAGASLSAVRRGLARAKPYAMRMQIDNWRGVGIINDAYNANPASMQAALKTLAEIPSRGRKIAVLGDMFELGRHTVREHRELGKAASKAKLHHLYLLGAQADAVRLGALSSGMPGEKITVGKDHADIAAKLRAAAGAGDWLLIKGSRGMTMEKILRELNAKAA
jgi:UDP-N-acetylmuramoyl-tripeptide--D-alanyl-D-alanine ligase